MCSAWLNVLHMSKMIQIRNVPDDLHRTLKVRAAQRGMSLSDYLLAELEEVADKPTMAEWVERVRRGPKADIGDRAVEIIREARGPIP
jgi:plasmid stability protein